jgi:hypothetical protein
MHSTGLQKPLFAPTSAGASFQWDGAPALFPSRNLDAASGIHEGAGALARSSLCPIS